MICKSDRTELQEAITAAVTVLCKNRLGHFKTDFSLEGLIGISLNEEQTFLISIKKDAKPSINQKQDSKNDEPLPGIGKSNMLIVGPKERRGSPIKKLGCQNLGASECMKRDAPGSSQVGSSTLLSPSPLSESAQIQTKLGTEQKRISSTSKDVCDVQFKSATSAKSEKNPKPRPANKRKSSKEIGIEGFSETKRRTSSRRTSLEVQDVPVQNKTMHLTSADSTDGDPVPTSGSASTQGTQNLSKDAAQLIKTIRGKTKCLVCDGVFKTKQICLRHIRYKHLHIGAKCEICGRNFRHMSEVRTHRTVLAANSVAGFPCGLCNLVFKTSCGQKEHSRTHSTDDKLFHCYLCPSEFGSYWQCIKHVGYAHPPCQQCGVNVDPSGLEDHRQRYHSEMTTDMIDIIDIESDTEFDDEGTHHDDSDIAPEDSSNTNLHSISQDILVKVAQKESDYKSAADRSHVCEVCQSAFTLAREYERHLLVHPWCEVCGARILSWSQHMQVCVANQSSDDEDQRDAGNNERSGLSVVSPQI